MNSYLTFAIDKNWHAVEANHVKEIIFCPNYTTIPLSPSYYRGVFNLRGKVVPLVDCKKKLTGLSELDAKRQLIATLHAREQDHLNWLAALDHSLKTGEAFTKARDPHQCAFGKWYDSYTNPDRDIQSTLAEFDLPHKKIHGLADHLLGMSARGQRDEAILLINRARDTELAALIGLFSKLRAQITTQNKELTVVLHDHNRVCGITVDSVGEVAKMEPTDFKPMETGHGDHNQIAVRGDKPPVILFDIDKFFSEIVPSSHQLAA